jgi:beta-mannosidase
MRRRRGVSARRRLAGVDGTDLSGSWRAALADEPLRRAYAEPDFDDGGWAAITVPSHWRSHPAFATADGPLLYRTRFTDDDLPVPDPHHESESRTWLVLDGVFYTSDIWLNGTYVGDTEGYFFPHGFEVTEAMRDRDEHVLALEVGCSRQTDLTKKRNLTGAFQHARALPRNWNPGGIWRPVRVERSGPIRILHSRVLCLDANESMGSIFVRLVMETREARPATLRTRVRDLAGREVVELVSERQLAAGENRLEWTVSVPNPRLWWPWTLGDQPRYAVEVDVSTDAGTSDRCVRSIGFRRVSMRNWRFTINGERLFLKGSNLGPIDLHLAESQPSDFERDVRLAREANLDFVRVHAHVSRPELYDAADAQGLLVWQDLPLTWGYARSVRAQARRQAREAVDLLGNHPSVVLWCGHNEPFAIDPTAPPGDDRAATRRRLRKAAGQLLPSWNRSVLDRSIATVLAKSDRSRPVVAHSGVLPHLPQLAGTDNHWFIGWTHGDARQFATLARWWPRVVRFVSEFGAQSVPADASFLAPERWPDVDWEGAARDHGLDLDHLLQRSPATDATTFDEWRQLTQTYQADLVRRYVHTMRLLKYRPAGGFAHFDLVDAHPAVSWSVLDHERTPKLGYHALRDACAPTIVTTSPLPPALTADQQISLGVFAVNDRKIAFADMVVTLHLHWSDHASTEQTWRWVGDLPADGCVRIGAVDVTVPTASALELRVELLDADGAVVAQHHDRAPVRT